MLQRSLRLVMIYDLMIPMHTPVRFSEFVEYKNGGFSIALFLDLSKTMLYFHS